jgi:polyisoprenoid-binding protein YceI
LLAIPALLPAATCQIDPTHSSAQFAVRHMMVSNVTGAFTKLSGTVEFDPNNPAQSHVDVAIDARSSDTREPKCGAHLNSAGFFDVAAHPTIAFRSRKVERAGEGRLRVVGDLPDRPQGLRSQLEPDS